MSTLHVLSHSPFSDTRLASCLRILGTGDALLLCGDAVYGLQPDSNVRQLLEENFATQTLFVLNEDLVARSLECPPWVTAVDYPGFVQLSIQYDKVNTWL